MRLLTLTSSYPLPGHEAASPFLEDWASALVTRGHEVHVVCPCSPGASSSVLHQRGVGISTFQYFAPPSWQTLAFGAGMYDNVARNPARLLQFAPLLMTMARRSLPHARRADLIHAHWLLPGGIAGAVAHRLTGRPLTVTVHSTDFHLLRRLPGGRALARYVTNAAARVHFVADYLLREFEAWLPDARIRERAYVAPMGVSDHLEVAGELNASPTVGFIGRLVPIKGVDGLLRACASASVPTLKIAGAGPERTRLGRLASDLRVSPQFLGRVSGATRQEFYAGCDVMVFPSRRMPGGRTEGLPVALLEAMACGRVVIAADTGGIPEIVVHARTGYLFEANDDRALSRVLKSTLSSWSGQHAIASAARDSGSRWRASVMASVHETAYQATARASGRA